jgi:hypothetical protein
MGVMVLTQHSRFYPAFGMARLASQRGHRWADLVDWIAYLPGSDAHVIALTQTLRQIARTSHSLTYHRHDPFCTTCAADIVDSSERSEDDLLALYYRNLHEIVQTIRNMRRRELVSHTRIAIA